MFHFSAKYDNTRISNTATNLYSRHFEILDSSKYPPFRPVKGTRVGAELNSVSHFVSTLKEVINAGLLTLVLLRSSARSVILKFMKDVSCECREGGKK